MSIKVLLYGARGWIGRQIVKLLEMDNNIVVSDTRITCYDDVMKDLIQHQPTHVISTVGRTSGVINNQLIPNIDYLEYPGKLRENINDNLYVPILIALATQSLNIHFTYLGTGCIYEYISKNSDYHFKEDDLPNFFGSSYSTTKGYTDQIMKNFPHVLNARIRMPITYECHPKDFITKISGFKRIHSIPNSMTVLDDLLPVLIDLTLKNFTGTINLVNPGVIDHNEILEMYQKYVNNEHTWENVDKLDYLKSKRSNNHLDTSLLESLYPLVPDIKTSVRRILESRQSKIKID
jgi:nucleoside-diphosphate-sugar epimerase